MDSNETLYGGDPKFLSEINKLCETLIGQILDHLKALGRDEVRDETGKKKKKKLPQNPLVCFADDVRLFPAAEYSASGRSGLFPLWSPAGSWGPEEQQTEPAVCQPVEPQPQTRLLRDPHVGGFTRTHTHTHHSRLCQLGQDSWIDPPSPSISAPGSNTGVHQTPSPAT